ncbi:microtubule-associated protein 2 isoform X3 [Dunckerocampus dactyliophorus]|uniref:microtubule-associated protein 2 isoform X3 n=1 Tax=Dunckerocampus dactyliophorus TaxID=161453 RepID=UPI0024057E4A|nr:microtubule-associated protein 2 isoform X3 [Dunckerocampus dactyliophorus]
MADDQQPEDGASQWDPSGGQEPTGTHGANGFSSSYRTCQTAGTHAPSVPFSARENGFNGELTGAHAITAEQVSARIVQEVTAEAVAVLKGEQESQRLPSVEDTTNLPPSPPPSPAAEHFGPLEQDVGDEEEAGPLRRFQNSRERCKFLAPSISVSVPEDDPYHSDEEYYEHPLFSPEWTHSGARPTGQAVAFRQIEAVKMDSEKPGSEKSGSMSPDSIGSEKRPEEFFESQSQEFFAGERVVPESPTIDMPSFVPPAVQSQAKESAKSITLQPVYGEPLTVSEKQPSVEVVEFSSLGAPSDFSSMGANVEGGTLTSDAMSAYFETSTTDVDVAPQGKSEGYYELSRVGEEKNTVDSKLQEISSTVQDSREFQTAEETQVFSVPERSNECKLSPGKLALEQRSYSLNITIGALDQSGQGRIRNFSPLATDIMSYTSGSLDETADYLPITTPSGEKPPPFPPLILETAASVTSDSSSPPRMSEEGSNLSQEPESPESPESPQPCERSPKNNTVMAQDLPEMLDLAGTRSRLTSEDTDPEIVRRKSIQVDVPIFSDDPLASFVSGEQSPGMRKSDSQLEEMGYCVFSEYSGPMPSPADVISPTNTSAQVFTPSVLEEKVAEQARKLAVRDTSTEDESPTADEAVSEEKEKSKEAPEEGQKDINGQLNKPASEEVKTSALPAETFVTPTVTVTLEEGGSSGSETERQASGEGSASETEIADYERQIRKLEMEDRPLSLEEERELRELREKVKLVHQEAYEEVDAEDVYQLTGVAKDRIARPVKTSPTSSVESNIDDDKLLSPVLSPSKLKQKELYGSPKRAVSPVLAATKDGKEIREQQEKEAPEKKIKDEKEETEKKAREETEQKQKEVKDKEEAERIRMEEKDKEKELRQKEEREKEEREIQEMEERGRIEKDRKEKEERGRKEKEEAERTEKERKEKEERERKEKEDAERIEKEKEEKERKEKEEAERIEKERKEKEERELKEKEEADRIEKERKEKEERELKEKEEKERKEKEERDLKEREEKERKEKERELKEREERERKENQEREIKEREDQEKLERERKEKEAQERKEREEKEKEIQEKERKEREEKELMEKEEKIQQELKKAEETKTMAQMESEEELARGAGATVVKEITETCAAIESVVTVEDDFITVVQTIDEAEEPGHSVRFSAPPESEVLCIPGVEEEEEEDEEEASVELAQEANIEAESFEEVGEVSENLGSPEQEALTVETEGPTESYDRDETTMDDSILDSSWVDTQDDDKSMATEQIQPLPKVPSPVQKPTVAQNKQTQQKRTEKPVKAKSKGGRVKGRIATPERKPVCKEPVYIPREEVKKKKAMAKKTELTKKTEAQTLSPSKRSGPKPAFRQTRPTQHHSVPRRRLTDALSDSRHPFTVARRSCDRALCHAHHFHFTKTHSSMSTMGDSLNGRQPSSASVFPTLIAKDGRSQSPDKTSSVPRHASALSRRGYHEHEDSSTSITSSGSTAPRRPMSCRAAMRAEYRTGRAPSMTVSEPVRSRSARSGHSTPRTPGSSAITPGTPPSYSSSSRTPGTPRSLSLISQERRVAVVRTPPKSPATTPKQLRIINQPLPDFKKVKSKVGSIDNIKYQPKGGQKHKEQIMAVEAKHKPPFWIWNSVLRIISFTLCLSAAHSMTWTQDLLNHILNKNLDFRYIQSKCSSKDNLKQPPHGGNPREPLNAAAHSHFIILAHEMNRLRRLQLCVLVLIPSVKLDYSHVQSRCGSLDRRGYSAGGGNVQIQNKKIDLSHVTSKCGSLDNIHHRPGGGNVRIESVKLDFKDKAQAKVGSLDNAHHTPGGGRVTIESHRLTFRDHAKARVDHGAEIIVRSPDRSRSMSPQRQRDSHLSSSGSLNVTESPQLATLAEDVTAALAKQGL